MRTSKRGRYMIDAPRTLRASTFDPLRWNKNAVYKHPIPKTKAPQKYILPDIPIKEGIKEKAIRKKLNAVICEKVNFASGWTTGSILNPAFL